MTLSPETGRYRIFNWTVLGLTCYMAALPVVGRAMRFLLPQLWHCAYRSMTGRPCPFCGTTGDLARLWQGDFALQNPATPLLAAFLAGELCWRIFLLCRRRAATRKWMRGDLLVHIALLVLLLGAYLWFWSVSPP